MAPDAQSAAKPAFDTNAPYQTAAPADSTSAAGTTSTAKPVFDPDAPYQTAAVPDQQATPPFMAATPKASYLPTADDMKSVVENPVGASLTLPIVKMLIPVHEVLDKARSLTQAGRQDHPILAKIGDLADNIQELLTGGQSAGKPMGTKAGVASPNDPEHSLAVNPITAISLAPAAAEAVPQVLSDVRTLQNPFRNLASKFTGSNIQPALKTGIQDVWNTVADEAGVARPTAKSVRDLGEEVGDAVYARSKDNYRAVDAATEGRFSGTARDLKSVNKALRAVTSDAEENALQVRKTRLEMQMGQMMDDAEAKGVPKETVDAAKADFRKSQAIYDTNHQVRMSTSGVRPGMKGATDVPEETNAKTLMNRLNTLYNKTDESGVGRLQQAVGEDGANDLIGHSANAQKAARNVARNRAVAKYVVPTTVGAGATAAYELTK